MWWDWIAVPDTCPRRPQSQPLQRSPCKPRGQYRWRRGWTASAWLLSGSLKVRKKEEKDFHSGIPHAFSCRQAHSTCFSNTGSCLLLKETVSPFRPSLSPAVVRADLQAPSKLTSFTSPSTWEPLTGDARDLPHTTPILCHWASSGYIGGESTYEAVCLSSSVLSSQLSKPLWFSYHLGFFTWRCQG